MEIQEIKNIVSTSPDYNFLKNNPYLNNILLLGLGGSHSYGTERPGSDIDIRGVAANSPQYILSGADFEQVVDVPTDTTIYSLDKIIKLFCEMNPNTIELLGLKDEHYLIKTKIGQMLLDNKKLFLSQRAIFTFGGYANAQLRRMENKAARVSTQEVLEENMLKSIEHAMVDIRTRHPDFGIDGIKIYTDVAMNSELNREMYLDVVLNHYPLRDYANLHSELMAIVKSYNKNNHRNTNAITHDKLGKHMMHLVRLYLMCFDLLERGEIITYRENEHDILLQIRDGGFLDENRQPVPEFYELLDDLANRFEYAKANTVLPTSVDTNKVREFHSELNRMIVMGEI